MYGERKSSKNVQEVSKCISSESKLEIHCTAKGHIVKAAAAESDKPTSQLV